MSTEYSRNQPLYLFFRRSLRYRIKSRIPSLANRMMATRVMMSMVSKDRGADGGEA